MMIIKELLLLQFHMKVLGFGARIFNAIYFNFQEIIIHVQIFNQNDQNSKIGENPLFLTSQTELIYIIS